MTIEVYIFMTIGIIIITAVIVLFLLYLLSVCGRTNHPGLLALQGKVYAHRGLHDDKVPENSMEAFRRAKEAGYGVELDVHLLKDGNLAVFHDGTLVRMTGAEGFVKDLTTEQLKEYRLNGTDQTIPTFQQVLDLFDGQVPLIVELKAEGRYPELCEKTCRMLDTYKGIYCLESFDPRCIRWLRKNRPDLVRGQLCQNYFKPNKANLPWILKVLLSNQMLNFLTKPDFIAYQFRDRKHFSNILCRKFWGIQGVTWTVQSKADFDTAIKENWIVIFEGFQP